MNLEEYHKAYRSFYRDFRGKLLQKLICFLLPSLKEYEFCFLFETKFGSIYYSMTPKERRGDVDFCESRIKRIAKGSGNSIEQVKEYLTTWKVLQKALDKKWKYRTKRSTEFVPNR